MLGDTTGVVNPRLVRERIGVVVPQAAPFNVEASIDDGELDHPDVPQRMRRHH